MNQMSFEWTPDFWQKWRESDNPYRKYKSERDRRLVLESLQVREGERVLEVGCGYGWISRALWDAANIKWFGIDRSAGMIGCVRATSPEQANRTLISDATGLPFRDDEFDKVLCTGVLMHIAENKLAVSELIRVLRPGGVLLCSINNALSPFSILVRCWNLRKKGFVQKFHVPAVFRSALETGGLRVNSTAGDGIIATAPIAIGGFNFPPVSMFDSVCRWDEWISDRFASLAYEVWFRGVKVAPSCAS